MNLKVDYPWAIPFWSHPNNYYRPENHGGVPNRPRGFVLHTPEEPAGDGYPGTPNWFAKDLLTQYGYSASTHYFLEAVEDPNRRGFCKVYQCVPESCAAVANGVLGKPYPAWADRNSSLNWQTLSLEWEGYAASIDKTIDAMQMRTAAHLISHRAAAYGFATDREHVIGHYQVSVERTDPGPRFPWDALMRELNQEDDMFHVHDAWSLFDLKIAAGQQIAISARDAFGVPPQATRIDIEFLSPYGYLVAKHGTIGNEADPRAGQAGRIGWARVVDGKSVSDGNANFTVELNKDGIFYLWAEGPDAALHNAHVTAWY